MQLEFVEARDLPDAWFQCVYRLLEKGREYSIDRGSYEGQKRLEFDYVTVHIKYPGVKPLLPDIPQERIRFVGNAASTGAKMALLSKNVREDADRIRQVTEHIELAALPEFMNEFMNTMTFP